LNVCLHDTAGCQTGCQTGFDNRFDNRVERTATVRSTGCQTGLYNRIDNRLYTRYSRLSNRLCWMFVYTIQPVVKPVWQPVWRQVVSCKRAFRISEKCLAWLPAVWSESRRIWHLTGEKYLATVSVAAWCYWSGAIICAAIIYRAVCACALVYFRALLPADAPIHGVGDFKAYCSRNGKSYKKVASGWAHRWPFL